MVVGAHEAATGYCVGSSKFLIVCAHGWMEEHVGQKRCLPVSSYM